MRFCKHLIPLLLFVSMAPAVMNGQSVRAYLSKGLDSYQARNYSSALAYFQVVIEETGERTDALFYAGESARQMRSYQLAESYLEAIPEDERRDDYALTDYYLAMTKKSLEKFDEAIALFQKFAANRDEVSEFRSKALKEIDNCEWAKEMIQKPVKVDMVHFNESINTIFSDYAPMLVGDTLYYTSTDRVKVDLKKKKKKKSKRIKPGRKKSKHKKTEEVLVTRIFASYKGQPGEPIRQNSRDANSFTANIAFNPGGSRMYYTICDQLDADQNIFRCQLYYRDRQPGGRDWGRAVSLPERINMKGTNSTQPAIGVDPATGQESLYFVSDRPGGRGKFDIWVSVINQKGDFSDPINFAFINTPEDELTPFFESVTQTLYFSSDGYQNFGGYDVFKTKKLENSWTDPENLGYPINSSYDDLYYVAENTTGKAVLASNREGVYCISPDRDCNLHDIYEITNQTEIMVSAFNEKDFSMVYGAKIELENLTTHRTEVIQMNPDEYKRALPLHPEHNYRVSITGDGYETGYADIQPKDLKGNDAPKKYIFLKPWTQMIVRTLDAKSKRPLNGMSLRVTDLLENKSKTYHIRADESECSIPVKTDREYEIVAIKSGFDAVSEKVSMIGQTEQSIHKDLFLQPFFNGLPLTIYFDNDQPSAAPEGIASDSKMTYDEIYEGYFQKKGEFIGQYAGDMVGVDGEVARIEAARFFDSEIQSGYYDLLKLSENLLFALKNGEKIELTIEGYASPLADDNYNKQLAERRIQTVLNHFNSYKNGILVKYIGKELTIRKIPYGEQGVDAEVSDNANDRRSSVYSPKASRERRVIIGGFRVPANSVSTSLK